MIFEYSTTLRKIQIQRHFLDYLFSDTVIAIYVTVPEIKSKLESTIIGVTTIGAKRMKSLNKEYRKIDKSTDILTFEFHEAGIAGEMYLSLSDIASNARRFGRTLIEEFVEIFIHGLLHMSGLEHGDYMFRNQKILTDKILKLL